MSRRDPLGGGTSFGSFMAYYGGRNNWGGVLALIATVESCATLWRVNVCGAELTDGAPNRLKTPQFE